MRSDFRPLVNDDLGLGPIDVAFAVELARLVNEGTPDGELVSFFLRLLKSESEGGTAILCSDEDTVWPRLLLCQGIFGSVPIAGGRLVGFSRHHIAEHRIALRLRDLSESGVPLAVPDQVVAAELGGGMMLSAEQRLAVVAAARGPFTLISGGPGTGKTSIVVALIRTLANAGVDPESIAMAAPTGKAANRMDESVRRSLEGMAGHASPFSALPAAQTLHRLLGFSPATESFRHDENHPLSCRVCIVDEGSMVDVALFERLLSALPSDASLILLGDADQLPSVEVGAVFREWAVAPALAHGVVRLSESFRMRTTEKGGGRNVYCVANRIRKNDLEAIFSTEAASDDRVLCRHRPEDLGWRGVEHLEAASEGDFETLLRVWLQHGGLRPQRLSSIDSVMDSGFFEALEAQRILCFTRVGLRGSELVNEKLHDLYCRRWKLSRRSRFCPGEPVMVTRNDYVRNIFNGDMGVVVEISDDSTLRVAFPRYGSPPLLLPLPQVEHHLELAFAITTHKSQGSEFQGVMLLLPLECGNASRELLYTALTRARSSVVLAGQADVIFRVAANRLERRCFLGPLLSSNREKVL